MNSILYTNICAQCEIHPPGLRDLWLWTLEASYLSFVKAMVSARARTRNEERHGKRAAASKVRRPVEGSENMFLCQTQTPCKTSTSCFTQGKIEEHQQGRKKLERFVESGNVWYLIKASSLPHATKSTCSFKVWCRGSRGSRKALHLAGQTKRDLRCPRSVEGS